MLSQLLHFIERMHRGLKPDLKVLLSDVLNEIEPVKVVTKKEDIADIVLMPGDP